MLEHLAGLVDHVDVAIGGGGRDREGQDGEAEAEAEETRGHGGIQSDVHGGRGVSVSTEGGGATGPAGRRGVGRA